MTWRSFHSLCRKHAKRVPYHPEAFLQDAPAKPPSVYYRFAALAGSAAVLVVALAAVLLSNLFQPTFGPGPGYAEASSSNGALPAGVDLAELYTYLAELSYTDQVVAFDARTLPAAGQLQYANQVYLREHGASLLQETNDGSPTTSLQPDESSGEAGTGFIPLSTAQALLDRLFGPNAKQLSEQETIGSFLSWQDGRITAIDPDRSVNGILYVRYSRSADPQDSEQIESSLLTAPLFYYIEDLSTTEDAITVKTAAFAPDSPDAWETPVDLESYTRLQSQLRNRRQTCVPIKTALYTFGVENGSLYLVSCRDTVPVTTTSTSSTSGTTESPSTWAPPGWTGPGDPPPLNEPVKWLGQTDPDLFMPLLKATALLGSYNTPVTSEEKQHAVRGLIPFIEVPYIDPEWNIQSVPDVERAALSEKLGIPTGLVVYAMPFDSLNLLTGRYFENLQYNREDLYPAFRADADDTQLVLDADSDTVYVVIGVTGGRNDVFVVADEQQRETVVQYTILYIDGAQNDVYAPYYAANGYAALQRYFLKTYRFWENSQVLHMDVDYQSGQPRLLSFQYSDMPFGKQKVLVEWAWEFIQVGSADPTASRDVADVRVFDAMTQQIKGLYSLFLTEDGAPSDIQYAELMACMTPETLEVLEKQGILESKEDQSLLYVYANDWSRGVVLSATETGYNTFDVVFMERDRLVGTYRRFSLTMVLWSDGAYHVASLPKEIK